MSGLVSRRFVLLCGAASLIGALALAGCDAASIHHKVPPKPLKINEARLKAEANQTATREITRDNIKAETDKLENAIRAELNK